MNLISVIVTTYNWPEALEACLNSLLSQEDSHFEIIIADDGSSHETQNLITKFIQENSISIKTAHHDDLGFRAGTIRNKAVALSKGAYLIFIDGDCIVLPNFIKRHRQLAERKFFVPGNRILLSRPYTSKILTQNLPLHKKSIFYFIMQRLLYKINRIIPFIYNPIAHLRYIHPTRWKKAMTCNLAMFKSDFIDINGFDEQFEGWGYEDSDLVIRLINSKVYRKEGRFAVPVLHCWHKQNDRSNHDKNLQRLFQRLKNKHTTYIKQGINQYL